MCVMAAPISTPGNTRSMHSGNGLSYSAFDYSNISLNKNQIRAGDTLLIEVDVTNRGKMAGDEVVQVYVQHVGSAVNRPIKELKAFRARHDWRGPDGCG